MPAPLAVDRSAVQALALQIGVREAARHFGLNENTVMDWSRQGKWLEPLPVKPLPPTIQGPSSPRNPAEATLSAKEKLGSRIWNHQARANLKGSRAMAAKSGEAIISQAHALQALGNHADKLLGWSKADASPALINIQIGPQPIQSAPAIDIDVTKL